MLETKFTRYDDDISLHHIQQEIFRFIMGKKNRWTHSSHIYLSSLMYCFSIIDESHFYILKFKDIGLCLHCLDLYSLFPYIFANFAYRKSAVTSTYVTSLTDEGTRL